MSTRRSLSVLLAAGATVLLPAAGAQARSHQGPLDAGAGLPACQTALKSGARSVTFEGRMKAIKGSARLQIRFDLETRAVAKGWARLAVPGFGAWNAADPGVKRYTYQKKVQNLTAPAGYRAQVGFRWVNAKGKVLATARRTTPVCEQPDLRPNLVAARIDVRPGPDDATAFYVIAVRNDGATGAGPFGLVLVLDGRSQPAEAVLGVGPKSRRVVEVKGPRCSPGATVAVVLDPNGAVDETGEGDNRTSFACPLPAVPPPPPKPKRLTTR